MVKGVRVRVWALCLALPLALAVPIGAWLLESEPVGIALAEDVQAARFHHVHLNVTSAERTQEFYETYFGALPVDFRDRSPALFTERSFILLDEVATPPPTNFGTVLWHIGWAGVDGHAEFEWRVREGIEVQTPLTPLGQQHYMYFWGPDRELVEIYTGSRNHRFEHVHLLVHDIEATLHWFEAHLGLAPPGPVRFFPNTVNVASSTIRVDNVNLILFTIPAPGDEAPPYFPAAPPEPRGVTDGTAIDHIAFSYEDIDPVLDRMVAAGVEIVRPIHDDERHGIRSFFVRGPEGLLVEIVQERPIPEGLWR